MRDHVPGQQAPDITVEVQRFRDWVAAGAPDILNQGHGAEWECNYPEWQDLWASIAVALRSQIDGDTSDLVLQVMAWDNETQLVADTLEDSPDHVRALLERALEHPDPNVRWQFAHLLPRAIGAEARAPLARLIEDPDDYVRRRAAMAADWLAATAAEVPPDGPDEA
ncbi:MAG: HEAT repeat domain-containing protein [Candidatus Nanopelagicales bacterium]